MANENNTASLSEEERIKIDADNGISKEQRKLASDSSATVLPSSVFYPHCILFLEGIQVPHNGITISMSSSGDCSRCSFVLPAANFLRDLPLTTKVLVVFKDFCVKNGESEPKWRVLFEGDIVSISYDITTKGANLQVSASDAGSYLFRYGVEVCGVRPAQSILDGIKLGNPWFYKLSTMNVSSNDIAIFSLLNDAADKADGAITSMGDIVYLMLKTILRKYLVIEGHNYPVARWYYDRLDIGSKHGYQILDRIFPVNDIARNLKLPNVPDYPGGGADGSGVPDSSNYASNNFELNPDETGVNSESLKKVISNTKVYPLYNGNYVDICAINIYRRLLEATDVKIATLLASEVRRVSESTNTPIGVAVDQFYRAGSNIGILKPASSGYKPYAGDILILTDHAADSQTGSHIAFYVGNRNIADIGSDRTSQTGKKWYAGGRSWEGWPTPVEPLAFLSTGNISNKECDDLVKGIEKDNGTPIIEHS